MKDILLGESIDDVSRALTHLVFRNGAVEDLHVAGKLSGADMKLLNKDVQNRIAGLLVAAKEGKHMELLALIQFAKLFGSGEWEKCEPYTLNMF